MNRCLLHINKLEDFKKYLSDKNIAYRPGKGLYEIIQIKMGNEWLSIYRRDYMPEHYTIDKRLIFLVNKFINEGITNE